MWQVAAWFYYIGSLVAGSVAIAAYREMRRLAEENGALRVNNAQLLNTLKQLTERARAAREQPQIARPELVVPQGMFHRKPS